MNNFVTKTSKRCYTNENVLLLIWLFDEDAEMYLHDWVVDQAYKADEEDREEEKKNPRKEGKKILRHKLRQVFRESLERPNHHDRNCPVILQKNLPSTYSCTT